MDMQAQATGTAALAGDGLKRVLVAEDSSITKDLLELVLSRRGFAVDSAADGATALAMLTATPYDVALIDYHLPGLNGLDLVARYDGLGLATRPRFVAVTGDIEGLLEQTGAHDRFDAVAPKPVDIDEICRIMEAEDTDPDASADPAPAPAMPAPRHPVFSLGYRFVDLPDALHARDGAPVHVSPAARRPDAAVVTGPMSQSDFLKLWQIPGGHLLPLIDLTGTLRAQADLSVGGQSADGAALGRIVARFKDARAGLAAEFETAETLEDKLVGRLYVSGRDLTPALDAQSPLLVAYDLPLPAKQIADAAQKLQAQGLLTATFFDRVHTCPACGSGHFNVREECPACGSAQLVEESYLHHFACAHQGPEARFRQGDDLVCPKCAKPLRHFGHDYDRPGTVLTCQGCGHATSEPEVGFMCAGCGTRTGGDTVGTRDFFAYRLSEQGAAYAEVGGAYFGAAQSSLRFADLPLELVVALNGAARAHNASGAPLALIDIAYRQARSIDREHGPNRLDAARALFVETLCQEMNVAAKAVAGQTRDFVLVSGSEAEAVRAALSEPMARAGAAVALDLGPIASVFGPGELF